MNDFNFWKEERKTSETYLRTNRGDWNNALRIITNEIGAAKKLLDIGSGDGHTTRQILSRLSQNHVCDLLEPNSKAVNISKNMLKEFPIKQFFQQKLIDFLSENKKYDLSYSIHSNYYWGKNKKGQSIKQYIVCLDGIVNVAPKNLILTQPMNSDYYEICEKNTFPEWVYSEFIVEHYKKRGLTVRQEQCHMKFYVGDLNQDEYAAKETWKFFNNKERNPASEELNVFLERINLTEENGNLNFRDVLLIIERQ